MAEQAAKKQRTIQVKIGNQAARAMTPDQAADYLKSIAGKGWGSGRELKMTFDNGSTSTVALPRTSGRDLDASSSASTATRSTSTRADGMPCSEKEMKALMSMFVEIMGLQMNTDRLNQVKTATKTESGPLFSFPADLPPPPGGWPEDLMWPRSEGEADDLLDSLPELEEIPVEDRPKMIQYAMEAAKTAFYQPKAVAPIPPVPGCKETLPVDLNAPVTGTAGIAPFEWGALERAAIEDALEQEERIRKDAGRDKKIKAVPLPTSTAAAAKTPTKPATTTAQEAALALQKIEAAIKKLARAVAMWRTRVASAVTQNEVPKLEALLTESPLPTLLSRQQQAVIALTNKPEFLNGADPHLEFLVPLAVPKNAASLKGRETRMLLAKYLLQDFSPTYFFTPGRNGRSAVHMACLSADYPVLKMIVEKARKEWAPDMLCGALLEACQDSGWTPLHYAVSSGSMRTIETLLKACGDKNLVKQLVQTLTSDTHTWKRGSNRGVTALSLAEALMSCKPGKMIETHGMALEESVSHHKLTHGVGAEASLYVQQLAALSKRLIQIETLGYSALHEKDIARFERELARHQEQQQRISATSVTSATSGRDSQGEVFHSVDSDDESLVVANGKKKQKKKKLGSTVSVASKDVNGGVIAVELSEKDTTSGGESEASKPPAATNDPLINALIGMGFEQSAIMEGIKACGGMSRATADDVVAWIFGGGEPSAPEEIQQSIPALPATNAAVMVTSTRDESDLRNVAAARLIEDERLAVEKLAAKREEQRRRNREWNNRAQARQNQEAQEKLSKTAQIKTRPQAGVLRTGLAPASNFFPSNLLNGVTGSSPTLGVAPSATGLDANINRNAVSSATRMVGRLNLGPSIADSGFDIAFSNDASTVASSVDHGVIEVGGNDDATVSTIGSFPAGQAPAPSSAYCPPGFFGGQMLLPMDGQMQREISQAQWEAHRAMSMNDSYGIGGYTQLGGGVGMGPPPGISESGSLLNHHGQQHPGIRSNSLNLPTQQSGGPPPALGSFSAASTDFAAGGSSLFGGSTAYARNDGTQHVGGGGIGSSLLSGGYANSPLPGLLERATTAPLNANSYVTDNPVLPSLFGFGSDLNRKTLDSSIIDSISTGNTAIGGSALWGGSSGPANGGSSLLGNLISNSNDGQPENALHQDGPDSLFARSVYQAGGAPWERERVNNVRSSSGGGNGSSIW